MEEDRKEVYSLYTMDFARIKVNIIASMRFGVQVVIEVELKHRVNVPPYVHFLTNVLIILL